VCSISWGSHRCIGARAALIAKATLIKGMLQEIKLLLNVMMCLAVEMIISVEAPA
jgi:cytochrome P450